MSRRLCAKPLSPGLLVAVGLLLAALLVPLPGTGAEEPGACVPIGAVGEYVINFDDFAEGSVLNGRTVAPGVRFMGDDRLTVKTPDWSALPVAARPPVSRALYNDPGAREFQSINIPVRIGFDQMVESVSVLVGVEWGIEPFTATLTAYGLDADGRSVPVATNEETVEPVLDHDGFPLGAPIGACLAVRAPGGIHQLTVDYNRPGGVMEGELIDNLIVRLPEVPTTVPPDATAPVVVIDRPAEGASITESFVRLDATITEDRELARVELWVNGGVYRSDFGFSAAGEFTYYAGINAIPWHDLINCTSNVFEVRAWDAAGNQGSDSVRFSLNAGDLEVVDAEPVQVLYGAPLVEGKATAFRVTVNSTFCEPVEAEFRLDLPAGQWATTAPTSPMNIEAVPSDWRIPEISGPVGIPGGANGFQVMLPFIADGMADAPWDAVTNPYGKLGLLRTVPRPIAPDVTFSVEVDPRYRLDELNESNNSYRSGTYRTVRTKPVFVVFAGQVWDHARFVERATSTYLDYGGVFHADQYIAFADEDAFLDHLPDYAAQQMDYLLGTYPVADAKVTWRILPTMYFRADYQEMYEDAPPEQECWFSATNTEGGCNRCFSEMMGTLVQSEESTSHAHAVALIQPYGCCGCNSAGIAVYVEEDGLIDGTLVHELGHQDIGAPDCYCCTAADGSCGCARGCFAIACDSCHADEGFWVNHWLAYDQSDRYYMDVVSDPTVIWTRMNPCRRTNGTEVSAGYLRLIEELADEADPAAVVVRGTLSAQGTATFHPFLRVDEAVVDLRPGSAGTYAVVFVDEAGQILASHGFTPDFTTYLEPEGAMEAEVYGFSYRIAWMDEIATIELRDAAGEVLASQPVSAHTPTVELLAPDGGEQWYRETGGEVRWEGTDPDGDSLSYALWISDDDGESWQPLAIDVTGTGYTVDTTGFALGDTFRMKVRVTDGVNTGVDASDGSFAVVEGAAVPDMTVAPDTTIVPATTIPPEMEEGGGNTWIWAVAGAALAGLAGVGLVVYGLSRRRRRPVPPPPSAPPPPPPPASAL